MATDPVDLSEESRALLRRDWAVRVPDAWAAGHYTWRHWRCGGSVSLEAYVCRLDDQDEHTMIPYRGATSDAARMAAAQAVYSTLPADVRADLGECP